MSGTIQRAREAGYTDQEINAFLAPKMVDALAAGYTQDEINKHLGIVPPPPLNEAPIRAGITRNLASAPKPVTGFVDALEAGWGISVAGLMANRAAPSKAVAEDAPWASRIASAAATMVGDVPAMVVGFGAAAGSLSPTGPGAVVGGMAGAFALPAAMRSIMMDGYEKGQFTSWEDAWPRLAGVFMDTVKGAVTGAATGAAGVGARALLPATTSPALATATAMTAEIGTMVTVGKGLEGHVPSAQDFVDAAILLGGFKFMQTGAARLRSIYATTGIPPKAVVADAAQDVTIAQDLAGGDAVPRAYWGPVEDIAARGEARPAEGAPAPPATVIGPNGIETVRPGAPASEPGTDVARIEPPVSGGGEGGGPPAIPPGGVPAVPGGEGPVSVTPVRTLEEAQQIVRSHISVGEEPPAREFTWHRLYTMTLDKLHPIETATREAGMELGISYRDIPTSENPYRLARLMAGVGGKADGFLRFGTRDFATNEINGPSLEATIAPVRDNLDAFRLFATSFRAMELEARGIATGFDMDAARQVVANGLDRPEFKTTLQGLLDYQNKTAQYLRDSGVLSRAGYDAMVEANRLYLPFQRVMDEGSAIGIRPGGNTLQARNPIKTIEGSMRQVIDPLESIIRNTYLLTQMAERNHVGVKLVDMLKRVNESEMREAATQDNPAEAAEVIAELRREGVTNPEALEDMISGTARPVRNDEIRVFRDGKVETWQVSRDLAEAFKGLDVESVNMVMRFVAGPARALRAGATLTPDFMARNLIRDFATAFVQIGKGVFTPIDTAKGLIGRMREDADYQNWIANGGASASWASLDRNYLQLNLEKLTTDTGLMTRSWNVIRHPVDALRAMSELSEAATRLGVFKKEMRASDGEGRAAAEDAAFVSRESTIDFARIGSKMRAMNMVTAFFNARVQGVDRLVRGAAENPGGMAIRIAAGITLPSVLLWWANHDQDWYKETPQWEKDLFWHFSAGQEAMPSLPGEPVTYRPKHVWRIPKPFELGVMFGSGAERALSAFYDQNPRAMKNFTDAIVQSFMPSIVPTGLVPLAEQFANRSSFTQRTLVPLNLEKQLPEYQYTPYTTETSKALGHLMGAFPGLRDASLEPTMAGGVARALSSPILMENYISAWTGGLGKYALQLADLGLRKAGVVADPVKPTPTFADIPFIRAFASRYPSASAQSIQDFHDDYKKASTYYDTWMARAQQGDREGMDRVNAAGGSGMFARLTGMDHSLSQMQTLIQMIDRNPQWTADEKRQLIDTQYFRMIEIARAGNQIHDQVLQSIARSERAAPAPAPDPVAPPRAAPTPPQPAMPVMQ